MLGFCRVFSDIKVTIFSRLTMEMLIGFVMCIFLIVQCSKKKPERSTPSSGSKQLLDQSTATKTAKKRGSKDQTGVDHPRKSGENVAQKSKTSKKASGKSGDGGGGKGTKTKSKLSKTGSKKSRRTGESESKSQIKQSAAGSSKPMDGTQNGPTPNDPTGLNSDYNDDVFQYDEEKMPMDPTIEETDNPAVHERVTRLAATDMIFDPRKVSYMGNVDNEKDPEEEKQFEKELNAACEKHEARFKDIRKLEERNPNYRRPKSTESEKSHAPVPPDQRIKMRPDQCVLFETKDLMTEEDEDQVNDDNTNKAS